LSNTKNFPTYKIQNFWFIDKAKTEYYKQEHKYARECIQDLKEFLNERKLLALAPDKGDGWCIVTHKSIETSLSEYIFNNFTKIKNNKRSLLQFLNYREGVIRRVITNFRNLHKMIQ